jgi:hypothetical protein
VHFEILATSIELRHSIGHCAVECLLNEAPPFQPAVEQLESRPIDVKAPDEGCRITGFAQTVLGGLWADDSWGRFWGWDPKENGALMIVLYNALVLHARWGGMVTGRGLALLAIGGNIVTTWSYFGTNELGVGLHAYGANDSSTAMWLLTFTLLQVAIIALGLMPERTGRGRSTAATG